MKAKQKLEEAMKLTSEQEKMIGAAVESAGPVGEFSGNLLSFLDLVKVQSLISKMGILIMETKAVSFKTERRALLEDNKEQEYQKTIQQFQTQQKITFSGVSKVVLQAFKIPMPVYQQSTQNIMSNPELAEKMNASQQ